MGYQLLLIALLIIDDDIFGRYGLAKFRGLPIIHTLNLILWLQWIKCTCEQLVDIDERTSASVGNKTAIPAN